MKKILTQLSFLKIVYSSTLLFFIVGTLVVPLVSFAQEPGTPPPAGPCTINKEKTRFVFPNAGDDRHLNIMDYGWYRRGQGKVAVLDVFADNCAGQKVKVKIQSAVTNQPIDIYKSGPAEYALSDKGIVRITYSIGEEQCKAPTEDQIEQDIANFKIIMKNYKSRILPIVQQVDNTFTDASYERSYSYIDTLEPLIKAMAQIESNTSDNSDDDEGISESIVDLIINGGRFLDIGSDTAWYDPFGVGGAVLNIIADADNMKRILPGNDAARALAKGVDSFSEAANLQFRSDCKFYAIVEPPVVKNPNDRYVSEPPLQYQCFNDEPYSSRSNFEPGDVSCFDGDDQDKASTPAKDTYHWHIKDVTENLAGNEFDPDLPCLDTFGQPIPGCQELLAPIPGFGSTIDDNLSIGKYINRIFQMVMGFLGMLAVGKIIYGGIKYMTTDAV